MKTNNSRDDSSPLLRYGSETARGGAVSARPPRGKALAFLALNGVAVLALLSVCVSMHRTISRLEGQLVQQTPGDINNNNAATKLRSGDEGAQAMRVPGIEALSAGKFDRLPMALLPSKFAVDYVTPRQDQAYRGTCWDFATIGFLEQSYREHGVRSGWLAHDEYVAFSEQVCGSIVASLELEAGTLTFSSWRGPGVRRGDHEVVHGVARLAAAGGLPCGGR